MNPKKKIYITLVVLGGLSILSIVLIIRPLFKEIKKNSEGLLLEKNNLILLEDKIKNLEESENLYKTHQSNLDKIDELFVNPEVPIEFVNFLENNAAKSQLSIEISSVALTKKETDPWPSLSFQTSTVGSFSNFLKFLEKLETSPYLIEIINLNVKKLAEAESDVEAIFSIKVFTKE